MLNPYVEIIARAIFRKETNIQVPSNEWDLAKAGINSMQGTRGAKLELHGNTLTLSYPEVE